ncbi:hypothetical protein OH540_21125 [Streptomyces sp. BPPL-273]|uniref:hypothetical protein n=1 Tax=Streptomyces sp. BPPL-273 TaxID=2987533 RepID=UPI0024AF0D33|nr:hypothetical protein [Streptomyces sp. BPPL-273]WHM32408.1 hypothetical protein OH540_21125 [Streptomyces sp. BPPL-273]
MTAMATRKRRAVKAPKPRTPHALDPAAPEAEFRRWSPEEVVALQLLPYRSARSVKEKCYRRELHHHRDGGRITFTADDLRRNNAAAAVEALTA